MTVLADPQTTPPVRLRSTAIDRARGLAIACMVADHLCLVFSGPELVRNTLGRVAMPVFFVLSGYLVRRLSWRHAAVALVGLLLPLVVPWVDSPNVLFWYALGAVVVWGLRDSRVCLLLGCVVVLGAAANGYLDLWGSSYNPAALVGLMLLGQLVRSYDRAALEGVRLPGWFALLGRYPLSWYVGHLLLIEATRQVLIRG